MDHFERALDVRLRAGTADIEMTLPFAVEPATADKQLTGNIKFYVERGDDRRFGRGRGGLAKNMPRGAVDLGHDELPYAWRKAIGQIELGIVDLETGGHTG